MIQEKKQLPLQALDFDNFLSLAQEIGTLHVEDDIKISALSDFVQIRQNFDLYVDKSLLLNTVLSFQLYLITRPSRWGKSVACTMIQYFFKMNMDQNGKQLKQQPYLEYFRGGKTKKYSRQLQPLKIWSQKQQFCLQHQAKYPVMYLRARKPSKVNYINCKISFIMQIFQCLQKQFPYIKNVQSKNLFKQQYCMFYQKMDELWKYYSFDMSNLQVKKVKGFNLAGCFETICRYLHFVYKNKCIVIIDQFDALVMSMISGKDENNAQSKQLAHEFSCMYQAICKDSNYSMLILSGIFNTVDTVKTSLNNYYQNSIFNVQNTLGKYFGFTKQEIEVYLIDKIIGTSNRIETKQLLMKQIIQRYNGYNYQECGKNVKIYNPKIFDQYPYQHILKDKRQKYSNKNALINQMCRLNYQWSYFNKDKCIELKYEFDTKILNLLSVINTEDNNEDKLERYVSYILISVGYLTTNYISSNSSQVKCYIPNKEIAIILRKWLSQQLINQKFFLDLSEVDVTNFNKFSQKMINTYNQLKNTYIFSNQASFSAIFSARVSMCNKKNNSCFFNTAVELYAGFGRLDTVFYPANWHLHNDKKCVVIHQYKYVYKKLMDKTIDQQRQYQAIYQILLRNYVQFGLKVHRNNPQKVERIILRGILIIKNYISQIRLINHQLSLTIEEAQSVYQYFKQQNKKMNQNQQSEKLKKNKSIFFLFKKSGKEF